MKVVIILSLFLLISPAFGELTKEDVRAIIREEVRPIIKEEVAASEKRMKEYVDLKIEAVNARIDAVDKSLNARIDNIDENFDPFWIVLITIGIAIILPQIIIVFITVYDDIRERKIIETEIRKLHERIEALSQ